MSEGRRAVGERKAGARRTNGEGWQVRESGASKVVRDGRRMAVVVKRAAKECWRWRTGDGRRCRGDGREEACRGADAERKDKDGRTRDTVEWAGAGGSSADVGENVGQTQKRISAHCQRPMSATTCHVAQSQWRALYDTTPSCTCPVSFIDRDTVCARPTRQP